MKIIFTFLLGIAIFSVNSQTNSLEKVTHIADTSIYKFVDEDATFPGDFPTMMKFLQENVIYPETIETDNLSGRVHLCFIVEKDGTLSHCEVLHCTNTELKQSYLNLLAKMPKWNPGKINGMAVRQQCLIPINICFSN